MDQKEKRDRLDVSDRLVEISSELNGAAEMLFISREYERLTGGCGNSHLLILERAVERYSRELHEIADEI